MPCRYCHLESLGGSGNWDNYFWFCCNCGDGPIGVWNPVCNSCGHPTSGSNHGYVTYHTSGSPQTEIEVRVAQASANLPGNTSRAERLETEKRPLEHDSQKTLTIPSEEEETTDLTSNEVDTVWSTFVKHRHGDSTSPSEVVAEIVKKDQDEQFTGSRELRAEASMSDISLESTLASEVVQPLVLQPQDHALVLERNKRLAHIIADRLLFNVDLEAGVITCTGGRGARGSASNADGAQSRSELSSSRRSDFTPKSKRHRQNEHPDENRDDDHGDDHGAPPSKRQRGHGQPVGPLFACIFCKRNRQKCRKPACFGPGFPDIHRLKEHLKRCHLVYQCPDCSQPFEDNRSLDQHQQQPHPCPSRVLKWFAINQSQWADIKPQSWKNCDQAEQWRKIFRICFPHVEDWRVPSPYYDINDSFPFEEEDTDGIDPSNLTRSRAHWSNELCRRVLYHLEQSDIIATVGNGVPDILRLVNTCFMRGVQDLNAPSEPSRASASLPTDSTFSIHVGQAPATRDSNIPFTSTINQSPSQQDPLQPEIDDGLQGIDLNFPIRSLEDLDIPKLYSPGDSSVPPANVLFASTTNNNTSHSQLDLAQPIVNGSFLGVDLSFPIGSSEDPDSPELYSSSDSSAPPPILSIRHDPPLFDGSSWELLTPLPAQTLEALTDDAHNQHERPASHSSGPRADEVNRLRLIQAQNFDAEKAGDEDEVELPTTELFFRTALGF